MNILTGDSQSRQHSLSDWLDLHELDLVTCRRILDALTREAAGEPAGQRSNLGYQAPGPEVAWLTTSEAIRVFLCQQQNIVDDTFEKTVKIDLHRPGKSRKALTLDNGPTAYPTILFSYHSEPSDCLILAHEFGHALQIRASRGKFVTPVLREVCAFICESALLSHTRKCNAAHYAYLVDAWHRDNFKYFHVQSDRLRTVLSRPYTPYKYSWNYPIARYLAIQTYERCSRDWIWSVFEGETSLQEVLRELALS